MSHADEVIRRAEIQAGVYDDSDIYPDPLLYGLNPDSLYDYKKENFE